MKTYIMYIKVVAYMAEGFLEWEMFWTKVTEKLKTHILYKFLNVTNEMQLLENFISNIALRVSGTLRPSSGAYGNCTCNLWC